MKPKVGMLVVLFVLGVSTLYVSSASAKWFVAGSELAAGKSPAIAEVADFETASIAKIPNLTIDTTCTGPDSITGGRIMAPDLQFVQKVRLLECHTIPPTPTRCQLQGGNSTIETQPVLALATLKRLAIRPETGNLYTTVFFEEGSACALEGAEPIRGLAIAGMPNGESELVNQPIEGLGSLENNSLEIGAGNKLIFSGRVLALLANHSKWSFR